MKKLISFLLSFAMLTSAAPSVCVADEENPNLSALASSFGADTDHFGCKSTSYGELTEVPYIGVDYANQSFAFSYLTAAVHNGIITADSLQTGAENLTDVVPGENNVLEMANNVLEQSDGYQIGYKYTQTTQEDMIKHIIELGEKAVDTGKYFLVSFRADNLLQSAFTMVGIGSANGNWTFNEKNYDKCILTLDPDYTTDHTSYVDTANGGFTENRCIYINSQTDEYYIPLKYGDEGIDYSSDDSDIFLALSMDEISSSDTDKQFLSITNSNDMDYEITASDGETFAGTYDNKCDMFKNTILNYTNTTSGYYLDGDLHISTNAGIATYRTGPSSSFRISTESPTGKREIAVAGEFDADVSYNKVEITKKPSSFTNDNDFLNENNRKYAITFNQNEPAYTFNEYSFNGISTGTSTFEIRPEGIYIADTDTLQGIFDCYDSSLGLDGIKITSSEPIMLKYDDTEELWSIYRDSDKNGDFESAVQKGDTNCDGFIDASDASMILNAYSLISTGEENSMYLDKRYADYDNDGIISATDASLILAKYAEISTE